MNVYLDNSASSFPKPPQVAEAMAKWFSESSGNPGRSSGAATRNIERHVFHTREKLAQMFDFEAVDHVIFTKNVTESINTVLLGYLKENDHVIITTLEHNAVVRPLDYLSKTRNITYTVVPLDQEGKVDMVFLEKAIKQETALIVSTHASNVTGDIVDLLSIGQLAQSYDIPFLVDAAQSAGVLNINMKAMHISCLCFTGHKGLMGPQGIGGFLIDPQMARKTHAFIFGGTGSFSESIEQPEIMPDKFESGTLNGIGIIGLEAGIDYIRSTTLEAVYEHECQLIRYLQDLLSDVETIQMIGQGRPESRVGVLSLVIEGEDHSLIAHALAKTYGISVRVGLQCAPLAHQAYNTLPKGTLRISVSAYNTMEEMRYTAQAIKALLSQT